VDTRTKILTLAAATRLPAPLTIATGLFDVLRAAHVRELRQAREAIPGARLLVVVLPWEDALLEQRARAEMAAALHMVDYVVIANSEQARALIDALQPARLVRLEAADEGRVRQLREHVRRRQTRA
jgi:bifunctional ADP-heptose synthase (sugar kinase/adenylyltransferase)